MVAASTGIVEPFMGLERFLSVSEKHCEDHPLAYLSADYFEADNRNQLRADFAAAKEAVSSNGIIHGFGLWTNTNLIGRFHEVQNCLSNNGYIRDVDLLPIEYNERRRTGTMSR